VKRPKTLAGLEEENGDLAEVEVDEVLGLVGDKRTKGLADLGCGKEKKSAGCEKSDKTVV
jgi:hypothetical protein